MIGDIRKFSVNLPRDTLLTICKSLITPHLDYGDMTNQITSNLKTKFKIFIIKLALQ